MAEQGLMASDRYGDDFLARNMPKKRARNRFFVRANSNDFFNQKALKAAPQLALRLFWLL